MDKDFARGEQLYRNPSAFQPQQSWSDGQPKKEENWLTLRDKKQKQKPKTFKPIPAHLQSPEAIEAHINGLPARKPAEAKPTEARWKPEPEPSQTPRAETQKADPTLVAATNLTPGMLNQPLSSQNGQNEPVNDTQTRLKTQEQETKPLDPNQDKKKLAWASPLDLLDYLGLGIDVLERAYIEIGMKPGQEKEFARFANTLYFSIDAAMAIVPVGGGGGLAVRASHEAGEAAWRALPASSKGQIIKEVAKSMGWSTTRASQAVNVFFSAKAGKGSGKDGKDGNKGGSNKRPADLPSSKKVNYDWDHIFQGHFEGSSTKAKGNKTLFEGLNQNQVKSVVQNAYKNIYKKLQTQGDKIRVRGRSGKWNIEMWVNKKTKKVETAYPIRN